MSSHLCKRTLKNHDDKLLDSFTGDIVCVNGTQGRCRNEPSNNWSCAALVVCLLATV